jgi:(2Fe-2S) ferredoxin
MRKADIQFRKLVLVCTHEKMEGKACCAKKLSPEFFMTLKLAIAEKDPSIRVSRSGCLGNCQSGAVITIMPDNLYLGEVKESDLDQLVKLITT